MKDVSQYPVKYGFGITKPSPPWSVSHPHLGVDRPTPMRTPLIINGKLVAYTGNTGGVDPHHHLQEVEDGHVVDPGNSGFNIPAPAVVYAIGQAPDIGKYVRIRDAHGVEWSHFHLDELRVQQGDQIGGDMIIQNRAEAKSWYVQVHHREASDQEADGIIGKTILELENVKGSDEWLTNNHRILTYPDLEQELNDIKSGAKALPPGVYTVGE